MPRGYLDWLRAQCASVELLGLRVKHGQAVRLNSVYVPLTATAPAEQSVRAKRSRTREPRFAGGESEPHLLLDRLGRESIYVTGSPGSGKSTFCRWVSWLVCEGGVPSAEVEAPEGFRETLPPSLVGRLPILVPLRSWWQLLPESGALAPSAFEDALLLWLREQHVPELADDVVRRHLADGTALLVLDGVDEIPVGPRSRFVAGLSQALRSWTGAGNRVLVTSRPYGLDDKAVRALALAPAPILPMSEPLQELLVQRWFRILADNISQADETAMELRRQVSAQAWLAPLTSSPLLLTSMCIVFGEGKRLPQDKHELYDRVVDAVLYHRIPERAREQLVRARLAVVAYSMHTGDGFAEARETPQAQARYEEIDLALRSYQERSGWSERRDRSIEDDREELVGTTGLLHPQGEGVAGFLHLSFQEFLAAQRLADVEASDLFAAVCARMARPEWRNTLSFVVGSVLATGSTPERDVRLVTKMIEEAERTGGASAPVAADAWEILTRREVSLGPSADASLRATLQRVMTAGGSARERSDAGAALAAAGDPRFDPMRWFLPVGDTFGFLPVTDGPFLMGSDEKRDRSDPDELPQHTVTLPKFYIGLYPVTVAQFRAYVESARPRLTDPRCLEGVSNHPVVRVTWHEAVAYCRWLTEQLRGLLDAPPNEAAWLSETVRAGGEVRLPSEAEWERAARGGDGHIYPWDDEFDPDKANTSKAGIGSTSTVGAFPDGVSL